MEITLKEFRSMGGKARAKALSASRRKEIAAMGGRRAAEVKKANSLAALKLNEKTEGIK